MDPTPFTHPPRSVGRRERKKLETRERISTAAFALFVERGYEATTVEAIAERADVAKGTVFNYFPQKRAFLSAIADAWTRRITSELGPVESWTGTPLDQLKRVARLSAELGVRHREFARLVIFESMREAHAVMAAKKTPAEPPITNLEVVARQVVARGQATGQIRADAPLDQAASLVAIAIYDALVHWLVRGGSVEQMQRALDGRLDIVFTGLNP
ncbi:MAG TPA: TetR/AcrR family transcriptional regulator [Longimicrobiales bacterium]|nr:TetR/AcrR family transcriptional regulator [Longimicrobiales bacterium]